jgi:hypothetical protein
MTNMNSTDFIKAVDHAAAMNDRWLFLAAFCLLLLLCGIVIYWLVRQLQSIITEHNELRREQHSALEQIITTQNATAMKLAICLDRNTAALQECSFQLRRFQEDRTLCKN